MRELHRILFIRLGRRDRKRNPYQSEVDRHDCAKDGGLGVGLDAVVDFVLPKTGYTHSDGEFEVLNKAQSQQGLRGSSGSASRH